MRRRDGVKQNRASGEERLGRLADVSTMIEHDAALSDSCLQVLPDISNRRCDE